MHKYTVLYNDDMCWNYDDKIPIFSSIKEANKDIKESIDDIKDAIKSGYMDKDSFHTSDDYEVVKIKFSDTDDQFITYHLDGFQERVRQSCENDDGINLDQLNGSLY